MSGVECFLAGFLLLLMITLGINCSNLLVLVIISELIHLSFLFFYLTKKSVYEYTLGVVFFVFVAAETTLGLGLLVKFCFSSKSNHLLCSEWKDY